MAGWRLWGLQPLGPGYVPVIVAAFVCYGGIGLVVRLALGTSVLAFLLYAVLATAVYGLAAWRYRDHLQLTVLRDAMKVRRSRSAQRAAETAS